MTEKIIMLAEDTETVINYSKYHIGDWAEVYTTDKNVMKRYEKFCSNHPDRCRLIREDKHSMTWSVDPKCASLHPRAPRKVVMTEEQKRELRERLSAARNKNSV